MHSRQAAKGERRIGFEVRHAAGKKWEGRKSDGGHVQVTNRESGKKRWRKKKENHGKANNVDKIKKTMCKSIAHKIKYSQRGSAMCKSMHTKLNTARKALQCANPCTQRETNICINENKQKNGKKMW